MVRYSPHAPEFNQNSRREIIMKILTCHHENLDLSSSESRHVIIRSRPVIMKISTGCHENLNLSSWKFQRFIIKCIKVLAGNHVSFMKWTLNRSEQANYTKELLSMCWLLSWYQYYKSQRPSQIFRSEEFVSTIKTVLLTYISIHFLF